MKDLYSQYFLNQKMMRTVLIALLPIILASIYYFGLKVVVLLLVNITVAVLVEYLSESKIFNRKKISEACLITAILYTMTLPISIPIWMSIVGIAFGIFFGKMVFGGFGKNIFNPAIVGRAFVYMNFPIQMTINWNYVTQFPKFPGGFGTYIFERIDMAATATPMLLYRNEEQLTNVMNLLVGSVSGVIGETSKILIILCAIYLIYKKVASWEIMAGAIAGFSILSFVLVGMNMGHVPNPLSGMLMGGFLFGIVFMATDPISAAKTPVGKWIYGAIIGVVTVIIRGFALFAGGVMFAILIGNTFAPIIDYYIKKQKAAKKAKKEVTA